MEKAKILSIFALTLLLIGTPFCVLMPGNIRVQASCEPPGTPYEIVIQPYGSYYPAPIMLQSKATFNVFTTLSTACCPYILLVMTNESYQGLTGPVIIEWQGGSISFPKTSFEAVASGDIPPTGASPSARYGVSQLKQYIGVGAGETLWWTYGSFLSGPITTTPQAFNVTLPSEPYGRMLVYAIGKSDCSFTTFNLRVAEQRAGFVIAQTIPGPVVPEPTSFLIVLMFCGAFGLYAFKRKRTSLTF